MTATVRRWYFYNTYYIHCGLRVRAYWSYAERYVLRWRLQLSYVQIRFGIFAAEWELFRNRTIGTRAAGRCRLYTYFIWVHIKSYNTHTHEWPLPAAVLSSRVDVDILHINIYIVQYQNSAAEGVPLRSFSYLCRL